MLRRDFNRVAALATATGAAVSASSLALAQTPRAFKEGADYVALDRNAPTEASAGKVEVIEFFWYSCPHCNSFEPSLEKWIARQDKSVAVRRVPVAFRDNFVPQQRLYYTIEAMGKIEELHKKVFYAIHVEKNPLSTQAAMGEWIAKQGVKREDFDKMYNSFAVQTKSQRATQLMNEYKVSGVPALGVAGRFYTDGALAQSMDRALAVVDYLVAEVRKGR
jgi:protein dithiol oxidoreductase (disulfide-forming)